MIKLVAFDWNGTIFSDTQAALEGVNEVLKFLNLKPASLKSYQNHFDVPVTKTYLGLGIPEKDLIDRDKEIVHTFHSNYEIRASRVRTRAYAKRLLEWLYKNKVQSIIFSNHIDEPIKKQLKRLGIEKYFTTVLANSKLDSSLKGRNKQEKLKNFIKNSGLSKSEVVIIGDTVEEIEIGKALSAVTVAITGGFCSTARLKVAKPAYLIHNLKEVINIIRKLNS